MVLDSEFWANDNWIIDIKSDYMSIEPVGSVGPKVSLADEINNARADRGRTINVNCPAQANPVPFYR